MKKTKNQALRYISEALLPPGAARDCGRVRHHLNRIRTNHLNSDVIGSDHPGSQQQTSLTFLLKLLHHLRHHVLVERLATLDDLDVEAVVNLLKL